MFDTWALECLVNLLTTYAVQAKPTLLYVILNVHYADDDVVASPRMPRQTI